MRTPLRWGRGGHEAKTWAIASGGNQTHCDPERGTVPCRSDCNAREKPRAVVQKRKSHADSAFPCASTLVRLGRGNGAAMVVPKKRSDLVENLPEVNRFD